MEVAEGLSEGVLESRSGFVRANESFLIKREIGWDKKPNAVEAKCQSAFLMPGSQLQR